MINQVRFPTGVGSPVKYHPKGTQSGRQHARVRVVGEGSGAAGGAEWEGAPGADGSEDHIRRCVRRGHATRLSGPRDAASAVHGDRASAVDATRLSGQAALFKVEKTRGAAPRPGHAPGDQSCGLAAALWGWGLRAGVGLGDLLAHLMSGSGGECEVPGRRAARFQRHTMAAVRVKPIRAGARLSGFISPGLATAAPITA